MRPRVVAASAATLIAAASLAPAAAQAAGQSTLYVNSGNAACDDSGTGAFAAPFCTIQAAADKVNPGDVVYISPGAYATGATITRSGTSAAPIVFTGGSTLSAIGAGSTAAAELTLSGVSNVEIENLRVYTGTSAAVVIDGGSNDTLVHDSFLSATTAGTTAVHVTNGASGIVVQSSAVNDGVVIDGGATGTILTTNSVTSPRATPISVQGATNTAITSNTVTACIPAISVTDGSSGTSIENNVVTPAQSTSACPASSTPEGVSVDASSVGSTHLDYNDVYAGSGNLPYSWNGTAYGSAADLYTATGQAQHDYNGADGASVAEHSPIINSADSAAIGELATDISGNPRTRDPLVAPTGAGPENDYDRGATQFQDPYTAIAGSALALSASKVPVGTTVTATATLADTWGDSFSSYEFEYGSAVVTTSTPTATFTPTSAQSGWVEVFVQASGSSTYRALGNLAAQSLVVSADQPLTPTISVSASGGLGVVVSDAGTTDAWGINKVTFDFGDQSPTQNASDGEQVSHAYAKAGTYTITETVSDANGATASTSSRFTTTAPPAGTLVNLTTSLGDVPADSNGIAQAAFGGSYTFYGRDLVAVTTAGTVEFASSQPDNYSAWTAWQPVTEPKGVTAKRVGVAGMPNQSTQLIEITTTGQLLHTVLNANGTWQTGGWGSPAGSTGFVRASITAMPDGSSQLVAVTSTGLLMHNIRYASGHWQGWNVVNQPGVKVVDAAITALPDGSSQIVELTSAGVMKHDIRFANGSWQTGGWGSPSGSTGITQLSVSAVNSSIVITAVKPDGTYETDTRNKNGSWTGWSQGAMSIVPSIADISISTIPHYQAEIFAVSGG